MGRTLKQILTSLPAARRKAVESGARELIQEELTLRDLRKAHKLTQTHIAEALHTSQEVVSRIENNSDLLLSTLRNYVEAVGGKLQLTVEFPGKRTVSISDIAGIANAAARRSPKVAAKRR